MSELQQKGLEFAKKIFDDIRAMSADVQRNEYWSVFTVGNYPGSSG